jgi:plasmid maintenance system antidote protein VapI
METIRELQNLLDRLNVTNAAVSKAVGVHERTIYKWLAGERRIPMSVILALRLLAEKKEASIKN